MARRCGAHIEIAARSEGVFVSTNYSGACFCGAVEIEVSGQPEAMGYCHCQSCRSWSASPVNAFTLWKPENVKVTKGADQIGAYHKSEKHHRDFCRTCGGHVMSRLPAFGLIDVFAATIPDFPFRPQLHVHYAETVLPMRDGLPKLRDFPAELGGRIERLCCVERPPVQNALPKSADIHSWIRGRHGKSPDVI